MTTDDIYPRVAHIVADVLAIDESKVDPDKRLVADLGAESIDYLDLIFRLEREFGVKIPRGQIEKEARGSLSDDQFEQGGVVTSAGLEALKQSMPEIPADFFKTGLKVNEIPTLFTVKSLCAWVLRAKEQQTTAAA